MPTKFNTSDLKGSLLGWLRRKGQTLRPAADLAPAFGMQSPVSEGGSVLDVLVKKLSFLKKYLSIILTILILIIGLVMGKRIASLFDHSIDIPKPAALPSTTTPSVDSSLTQLKQSIIQFNPQLPDPLMPEFNDSIALEELEE